MVSLEGPCDRLMASVHPPLMAGRTVTAVVSVVADPCTIGSRCAATCDAAALVVLTSHAIGAKRSAECFCLTMLVGSDSPLGDLSPLSGYMVVVATALATTTSIACNPVYKRPFDGEDDGCVN